MMRKGVKIICGVLLVSLCACARTSPVSEPEPVPAAKTSSATTNLFPSNNRIIDAQRLKQGGNLIIGQPQPGVGVVADERLDAVAYRIMLGLMETLKAHNAPFKILEEEEEADLADLVFQGYITQIAEPSKLRKWLPGGETYVLTFSGRMTAHPENRLVALIAQEVSAPTNPDDFRSLGHKLGKAIGNFIVSGMK